MCGIVGVIGNIDLKVRSVFKQMLEVDSLRGRHSTGVIKVYQNGTAETRKKAVDGMDFVKLEDKWLTEGSVRALLGHNRYATKGAINDVNAHPFTHGHIHGVHNGTLTQQWKLKDHTKFDVDSDNVFYNIMHEGTEKTVEKMVGAFAIALYNEQEKHVQIFRNDERPLSLCLSKDGKTLFYASESIMLEWILLRNGIEYQEVQTLPVGRMLTVSPLAITASHLDKKTIVDCMTAKELTLAPKHTTVIRGTTTTHTGGASNVVSMHSKGLDPTKEYPLQIFKHDEAAKKFYLTMLCEPFEEVVCEYYSDRYLKDLEGFFENDVIVSSTLHMTHGRDPVLACWSSSLSKATADAIKLIEEDDDLSDDELMAIYKNMFDDIDDEEARVEAMEKAEEIVCMDSYGLQMSRAEFEDTNAHRTGCCMCGGEVDPASEFIWTGAGNAACEDCVEDFKSMNGQD